MDKWLESDDWFAEFWPIFWATYDGKKLCGSGQKKGPKSKALEAAKKKIKTKEKAKEVIDSLREQIRFFEHEKKKGEWAAWFPMCVTWINQERWTTEIDSYMSDDRPRNQGPVAQCKYCKTPVLGPRYDVCGHHASYTQEEHQALIEWLKEKELTRREGENKENWRKRMVVYCKENAGKAFKRV